jgi:hypothetical protein
LNSLSPEPTIAFGGTSSNDAWPPVLGPSEWSHGLMTSMADSGSAWYLDRR